MKGHYKWTKSLSHPHVSPQHAINSNTSTSAAMDFDSDSDVDSYSTSGSLPAESVVGSMTSSLSSYERDPNMIRRSASPMSVVSVSSSMREAMYREEYGRGLNNYSDVYRLPADNEELDRLDLQDGLLAEAMGGKFVPPMDEVMADDVPGETKQCIDLGCGSGTWIVDVAERYPHCNAVAVDLIPLQNPSMPENLRSEVDDINLGLEHFYGDFNVVHARLISSGIKDYHRLIDQIAHVLRPGGLIDVSEIDFRLYDKHHRAIDVRVDQYQAPWWSQWMCYFRNAIKNAGGDVDAANHLLEWVTDNTLFEDVVYREFYIPAVSPKPDLDNYSERLFDWETKMREDVINFLNASRPLLLGSGLPEEMMSDLQIKCPEETDSREIPQFTRLQCVYARRKAQ